MAGLRISIVEYLNTAPLVWGFTYGPQRGKHELSFTEPSQCAEALRRGDADVVFPFCRGVNQRLIGDRFLAIRAQIWLSIFFLSFPGNPGSALTS